MWNIGTILAIAMRAIANSREIIDMVPRVISFIDEVRALLAKIAPELLPGGEVRTPAVTYDVRWLQASLNGILGIALEVDGDYGPLTKSAVAEFQRRNPPLVVDGWAGIQTEAQILKVLGNA